ncbi:UDP-N-acetylglucosamine 2-epimerase (non-hydrolyzing) [Candidatus Berkelbacteria bacterium]|nr:UDP-N-acetylglucosamine 2-epimerase (non-hydrolyzing) [Candidatus Berkelbacteria bacterium]
MKIAIILGTRPEIIKLAPILRRIQASENELMLIHTNQHYSANMDGVFFKELALPAPDSNLGVGSGTHGAQTGLMLARLEKALNMNRPDAVLVQGDTNTVLAGALAAVKLGIQVGHVEAGLRSYDRTMPEEINRVLTDHAADILFAPTQNAAQLLHAEGIPSERIEVTGNTIVDAINDHRELVNSRSYILSTLKLEPRGYLLLTLHRPANVDRRETLAEIIIGITNVARITQLPVVFPAHPRTVKQLEQFKLTLPVSFRQIKPIGYLDFLGLEANAELILTDSGGIQEEACVLRVPCVTIRENTERPETLAVGANELAGLTSIGIQAASAKMLAQARTWQNPFGDGRASDRILHKLSTRFSTLPATGFASVKGHGDHNF